MLPADRPGWLDLLFARWQLHHSKQIGRRLSALRSGARRDAYQTAFEQAGDVSPANGRVAADVGGARYRGKRRGQSATAGVLYQSGATKLRPVDRFNAQ